MDHNRFHGLRDLWRKAGGEAQRLPGDRNLSHLPVPVRHRRAGLHLQDHPGGKLLHFELEDIILASNANIGGPTTAAGMAISQGWSALVGPVMLVGTFGYVIGTSLGILVGGILLV